MFANNLRNAREAAGLTQEALAARLGIARTKISAWEIRRSEPNVETIVHLAEALEISTDELLGAPLRQSLRQLPQPAIDLSMELILLRPDQLALIRSVVQAMIKQNDGTLK